MSANSNYTWESTNSSFSSSDPNRKLKGWLVIAAGVSFLAHAGLWVWFTQTTLPETSRTMVEMMDKTQTFKIERVTLNDVVLQEDKSRDDAEMAEILNTDAAPLVKEINEDDPNIYDKLPEHQIRLTSEVEDMSKFLASERPSIKGENNDLTKTLAKIFSVTRNSRTRSRRCKTASSFPIGSRKNSYRSSSKTTAQGF